MSLRLCDQAETFQAVLTPVAIYRYRPAHRWSFTRAGEKQTRAKLLQRDGRATGAHAAAARAPTKQTYPWKRKLYMYFVSYDSTGMKGYLSMV